jgi:aminodeoxyfutalosine deaminase
LRDWIRGLPKPELHVHLEGTIKPDTYERIARRNGVQAPEDVAGLFHCTDFQSFLYAFLRVVQVLQKPVDFAELAYEYLAASAAAGVRHVELFMSPATQRVFYKELDSATLITAVGDACRQAKADFGISSLLLFDIVRNLGEKHALLDIELAREFLDAGVVGIGLGGDERKFPARDFQTAFAKAKEFGLRRTVHAGEAAGVESIADAVTLLGAERIGHAVAASHNPEIIALLRERQIAIDACPTSNRITGAIASDAPHPLPEFLAAGLTVTLNSDDPAFFGASLLDEYENAAGMGLSRQELARIAINGFTASFAAEDSKRAWIDAVRAYAAIS